MKIGEKDVEYVARLAHLELSEEETSTFTRQLDDILSYIETLNSLDTGGIEPTSHALPIPNPVREDEATASSLADELLAAGPDSGRRFFRVPRVIE